MKVRLVLDVSEFDRFVVAKYYSGASTTKADKIRTRATRTQMRRFTTAMLRTVTRDLAKNLPTRSYSAATRIETPPSRSEHGPTLDLPENDQRNFPW